MKMKMKKWFIPHSLTKTSLAALAAAVTLLATTPVRADTSWVRGGNWADNGDNFQTGIIYPSGITSSTTTTQASALADTIALDDMSVGINFVRIGINPATISGNWPVVQAYINELIADGMSVDLGFWTSISSVGTVTNVSAWETMWKTVDGVYSGNNSVYYEPINEPHGYSSESTLATDVYVPFLGFIKKSQGHLILDGTGYASDVTALGADSRFTSCLMAVHDYAFWHTNITTESAWKSNLQGEVGSYSSRTIMTEMGSPATTGLDYDSTSSDYYIAFIRGMCEQCRAWPMGFVYWPSHRANDTYRLFESPGGAIVNRSLINELQYGWNNFTPVSAALCDFNAIGTTDYSVYRPSNSKWYVDGGAEDVWGTNADIAVPADYAGTGQAQFAIWRPSNGTWYVYPQGGPIQQYGTGGDIPVPGDYLGAGHAQYAVFRPSNGKWYIYGGSTIQWGTNGDIPVPGYYNGDGHLDLAVYRPSNSKWYIYGGSQIVWGTNGDIPVPGDYNGNGTTQIATFRPSNVTWYVYGSQQTTFGTNGDIPVPDDYTGSGITQLATWGPSSYIWNVNGVGQTSWGTTGDVPLPLPYAIRQYLGYTH